MHTTTTTHTHRGSPTLTHSKFWRDVWAWEALYGFTALAFPLQSRMTNCLVSEFETIVVFKSKPILLLLLPGRVTRWWSFPRVKLQHCGARRNNSIFPFPLFFSLLSPPFSLVLFPQVRAGPPPFSAPSSRISPPTFPYPLAEAAAPCEAARWRPCSTLDASPPRAAAGLRVNTLMSLLDFCWRA